MNLPRCCTLLAVVLCLPLFGQSEKEITSIERFTTSSGLADNTVNALLVDRKGALWVGTENGLNRYLNTDFELFNEESSSGQLAGHSVSTLFLDSRGVLWVGDRFLGLSSFDPARNLWKRYANQSNTNARFEGKEIIDIVEDDEGDLWIAAFPDILIRYAPTRDTFYHHRLNIQQAYHGIQSLHRLNRHQLIVNTFSKGVLLFDMRTGRFRNYHEFYETFGIARLEVNDRIFTDRQGNLILLKDGVIRMKRKGSVEVSVIGEYPKNEKPVFHFTAEGSWLVGCFPYILHFDAGGRLLVKRRIRPQKRDSGLNWTFRSLCSDLQGVIWIGSDEGLMKVDPAKQVFRILSQENGSLPFESGEEDIRSVYTDRNGNLWAGPRLGGKIVCVKTAQDHSAIRIEEYRIIARGDRHNINCFLELNDGRILAAGYSGFFVWSGGKEFVPFHWMEPSHPAHNNCWALLQLDDGKILLGTKDLGLFKLDPVTRRIDPIHLYAQDGLPYPEEFATWNIYQDSKGTVWLATSKGLFSAVARSRDSYTLMPHFTLRDCSVWAICQAANGILWFGSIEHGLFGVDPRGEIQRIGLKEGLPSLTIKGIVEDDAGQLWVSTSTSISRISFGQNQPSIRTFDVLDGLPAVGFNSKAASRGPAGLVFFATKKGLLYFRPSEIESVKERAHLLLRNCQISERKFHIENSNEPHLILLPGNNSFSLEPALTDYGNPGKNRFLYLLEGVDQNWRKASGKHPFIQYAALLPGEYLLRVRAENPDGLPGLNELSIPVVVKAYFWQQAWFRFGILVCTLILLGYLAYLTLNRLRMRRKLLKSEIASLRLQMNPHFIFNSLNSIQDYIYHSEKHLAGMYLSRFARLMRLIMENSGKTSISLEEEITFLKIYLDLESLRLSSRLKYSIEIDPAIDTEEYAIPPMLLQPLIENALKHGMDGERRQLQLRILFEKQGENLQCSIMDNGVGIHKSSLANNGHLSRGLEVVRERLDFLNRLENRKYQLRINRDNRTFPGCGTEVTIIL